MARIIVREATSAKTLDDLITALEALRYFYGDGPTTGEYGTAVKVLVVEETLTDGSKVIEYEVC